MKPHSLITLGTASLLAFTTTSPAALVFTSASQSTTIDFQSNLGFTPPGGTDPVGDNVFKAGTGNHRMLMENASGSWTGGSDFGLSADAWSWSAGSLNLGTGTGARTLFGDFNNNSDLGDNLGGINAVAYSDRGTLGIGTAGDMAYVIGNNAASAPFRDYTMTLRVLNDSGSNISNWSMSLDTWYLDDASNPYNVAISYSTDNTSFTSIDGYTTSNTSTALVADALGGSFTASVDDGEYLYLQLSTLRPNGGSGARVVLDNWNVSAIPEPSTYALLAAGLAVLMTARRRG